MTTLSTVADYVRSLSGLSTAPGADLARGAKIFAANCAVCHGPQGKGNRSVGAPNLTDQIWLYGSTPRPSSTASGTATAASCRPGAASSIR